MGFGVDGKQNLGDDATELARTEGFDVVVVGSGYGAGAVAARLAETDALSVCVLERGREYPVGQFPKRTWGAKGETQTRLGGLHTGDRSALYDFHFGRELTVLVGCGLGGTSLINANVMLEPSRRVLQQPEWPRAIREAPASLEPYFARASAVLRPKPVDGAFAKLALLGRSAAHCGWSEHFRPAQIAVSHDGYGTQNKCAQCGDCVTGCNYGSKNTLCETYLPIAKRRGAKLFVECAVRWVEACDPGWRVFYEHDGLTRSVHARRAVVLAAGTLGSTEIMHRSIANGLAASARVGMQFSGNGDSMAVGYNFDSEVDSVGFGARPRAARHVGPTITGLVDLRSDDPAQPLHDSIIIEEAAFPGPIARLARYVIQAAAVDNNRPSHVPPRRWLARRWRELLDLIGADPMDALLNHSQIYVTVGHDDAGGTLGFADDYLQLSWPDIDKLPVYARADDCMARLTLAAGGDHVRNPLWKRLGNMLTVHPLGGCAMADDADHGVVDDRGRVFDNNGGTHRGLYIADGAIIPRSIGVNPLWTITALAERVAEGIRTDLGL